MFGGVQALKSEPRIASNNKGFGNINWNIETAARLARVPDVAGEALAVIVRSNANAALGEIAAFDAARRTNQDDLARRAVIFSMLSPQCDFQENMIAFHNLYPHLEECGSPDEIATHLHAPYKGWGTDKPISSYKTKAQYIWEARDFLRSPVMELGAIMSLRGMGDKTARFALALYDASYKVFTLDSWMFRLTLDLAGEPCRQNITARGKAYEVTERAWLDWSERYLPDVPPFAVQWTLWSLVFGGHVSHLGILN